MNISSWVAGDKKLKVKVITFNYYDTARKYLLVKTDIYFCACPYILMKSQAFWSEGSANSKTFSKRKDNYSKFKIEDCGNSKVDDGGYKDCQWQHFLL